RIVVDVGSYRVDGPRHGGLTRATWYERLVGAGLEGAGVVLAQRLDQRDLQRGALLPLQRFGLQFALLELRLEVGQGHFGVVVIGRLVPVLVLVLVLVLLFGA